MSSFRKFSQEVASTVVFICLALAFSYLEVLIPIQAIIPVAGFKLGLANIAVIASFYRLSPCHSFFVSIAKVILSSFLFGSFSSFVFSLSGAILSYAVLFIVSIVFKNKISFVGVSVFCALAHNIGQLAVAGIFYSFDVSKTFAVPMIFAAVICGSLTGYLLSVLPTSLFTKRKQ